MTQPPPCEFPDVLEQAYAAVRRVLDSHGITVDESCIRNPLISPIRAAMIRDEYNRGREKGVKSEALQVELAEKYGVSYGNVHDALFRPDREPHI